MTILIRLARKSEDIGQIQITWIGWYRYVWILVNLVSWLWQLPFHPCPVISSIPSPLGLPFIYFVFRLHLQRRVELYDLFRLHSNFLLMWLMTHRLRHWTFLIPYFYTKNISSFGLSMFKIKKINNKALKGKAYTRIRHGKDTLFFLVTSYELF